ncbi:MAG: GxxExxY protein [Acidobacteria bacterium]|nr:MAG: GxxExxY protein [Acidobacteriota bacterium]
MATGFGTKLVLESSNLIEGTLTKEIIGAAIEVHRQLGPGLLESAYEICMCHELFERRIGFQRQVEIPVFYKGVALDCGYKLDILVEDKVVLELRAVEAILPVHEAQLLTYLKLSKKRVGFLMNFHVSRMTAGIKRKVL